MPKWATTKRRWKRKPYRRQYSQAHRAKRRVLSPAVEAGLYNRARCHQPILPGQAWISGTSTATVSATRGLNTGTRVIAPKVATAPPPATARLARCTSSRHDQRRENGEPRERVRPQPAPSRLGPSRASSLRHHGTQRRRVVERVRVGSRGPRSVRCLSPSGQEKRATMARLS
jgi:hypothetical protein